MSNVHGGEAIRKDQGRLAVPDRPIVPFIEGDGTGPDIWRASQQRVRRGRRKRPTAASGKSSGRKSWPAKKSFDQSGNWLPDETLDAFRELLVGIKGPLTTPVGGGIRSLNVALRQMLDLFVCLRPVRYFRGVPSPVCRAGAGRHGHLPREHGRHLRRHRIRRRHARVAEGARLPGERISQRGRQDPLRHQGEERRLAASSSKRSVRRTAICRSRSASASSRSAISAPNGSCTARSATRSRTSARA